MRSPRESSRRLLLTALEDRTNPTPLTALTTTNQLLSFDSATPGTVTATVPVTGLNTGGNLGGSESLVAIDYRPSNGQLFGLAVTSSDALTPPGTPTNFAARLVVIDPATGAATPVGTGFSITGFNGSDGASGVGFDFNPTVDRIRLVTSSGQDLRLNPDTGAIAATDANLAYDPQNFDAFVGGTPPAARVAAEAYTLNPRAGGTVTTLYGLDSDLDVLFTQGGPEQDPTANNGQLFVVSKVGFDVTPGSAFDIEANTDKAFATSGNTLYSVNLTTGKTASLGSVSGSIRGLSVAPPTAAAGAGTFSLPASVAFDAGRGPVFVTVTRTGGSSLPATVDFATASGTAVAGADFVANSGTLSFAPGETSKQLLLALPGGAARPNPAQTFALTLSNPTGGASIGTGSVQVTIPAVAGDVARSGRIVAAAAGAGGGPRVSVYDAATGAPLYSFFAFESTFTGGLTVATADTNGDGFEDIIVGAGSGGGPRIAVFDGSFLGRSTSNRGPVLADFFAYESTLRSGVIVAAGDVNGDGFQDIVAGTGLGGGPRVRVFSGTDLTVGGTQNSFKDFFAYDAVDRGGVNVAAADLNADGKADLITGAGVGGGPRVRTFDGASDAVLSDFFAYDAVDRGGVFVAAGNVTGGRPNIVTGPGAGGGPLVRIFNGFAPQAAASAPGFFAFDPAARGGVRVATNDFGPDGFDEVVAATGGGTPAAIRAFNAAGTQVAALPFDDAFTGGLYVG